MLGIELSYTTFTVYIAYAFGLVKITKRIKVKLMRQINSNINRFIYLFI